VTVVNFQDTIVVEDSPRPAARKSVDGREKEEEKEKKTRSVHKKDEDDGTKLLGLKWSQMSPEERERAVTDRLKTVTDKEDEWISLSPSMQRDAVRIQAEQMYGSAWNSMSREQQEALIDERKAALEQNHRAWQRLTVQERRETVEGQLKDQEKEQSGERQLVDREKEKSDDTGEEGMAETTSEQDLLLASVAAKLGAEVARGEGRGTVQSGGGSQDGGGARKEDENASSRTDNKGEEGSLRDAEEEEEEEEDLEEGFVGGEMVWQQLLTGSTPIEGRTDAFTFR